MTVAARERSHREVLVAMSGLLLAMFVAYVATTIVTTALPAITADLNGTQAGYTWVVTAAILTLTASTPIWGRLADMVDKKRLVQSALCVFTVGSVTAAAASNMGVLIAGRAIQGLAAGGLTALVQVVIATMVPPHQRSRYGGYLGAVLGTATLGGPLIGGLVVDSALGWRGCFLVPLLFAVFAAALLQRHLHLPADRRPVRVDWLGGTLLVAGVTVGLLWVTFAGQWFAWASATSVALGLAAALLIVGAAVAGRWASSPVIPLAHVRDRTTGLVTLASTLLGAAMFAATVYPSQYFQLARGMTPTAAGLMSLAVVGGIMVSTMTSGAVIARTGRWKAWAVGGMALVALASGLLGTMDRSTPLGQVAALLALLGLGIGAVLQNLLTAAQHRVAAASLGATSSIVIFFRSLGGAVGVGILGAVLATQVSARMAEPVSRLVLDISVLPQPVAQAYRSALGDSIGVVFASMAPVAALALLCVCLIPGSRIVADDA